MGQPDKQSDVNAFQIQVNQAIDQYRDLEKKLKSLSKQGWLIERAHAEAGRLSGLFFEMEAKTREMKVALRSLRQTEDMVAQLDSKYQGASDILKMLGDFREEVRSMDELRSRIAAVQSEMQKTSDKVGSEGMALAQLQGLAKNLRDQYDAIESGQSKFMEMGKRWEVLWQSNEPLLREWEARTEQIHQRQEALQKHAVHWEALSQQANRIQEVTERIDRSLSLFAREKSQLERWEAELQQLARWREETRIEMKRLEQIATIAQAAIERESKLEKLVQEADERIQILRGLERTRHA